LIIGVSLVVLRLAVGGEVPPREDPEQVIQYLVAFVADSDWTFIRNGKEYTGRQAAAHMTRKYEHFKERIGSPEDFIRLAASQSLVSARPYLVRNRKGRELRSEEWLLGVLNDYRKAKSAPKPGSEDS
jgi:hypothetical protein